jgi:hypothetical protein
VEGDDEVVAGSGRGDVEEATAFVVVHLFVDWLDQIEVFRLD